MQHAHLGRTGLQVSRLCLGTMTFGFQSDEETSIAVLDHGSFVRGLLSFALICSFGAVANVGIATLLFAQQHAFWWAAGIAGAAISAVWTTGASRGCP